MRWVEYVARMRDMELIQNLEGRDHKEDLNVYARIILKPNSGKGVRECGLDSTGSGQDPLAGCCEHGN